MLMSFFVSFQLNSGSQGRRPFPDMSAEVICTRDTFS